LLDLEKKFILTWEWITDYLPYLIEGAKSLEKWWADFIVIPCNSVHVLIEQVRNTVKIPVISIVDETVNYLSEHGVTYVGMLSTSVTSRYQLYDLPLQQNSIQVVKISSELQKKLDDIIYKIVNNLSSQHDEKTIHEIVDTMKEKGVKDILLACTDLQLICKNFYEFSLYDTMNILAKSAAEKAFLVQ
jgi:aspartate racemase